MTKKRQFGGKVLLSGASGMLGSAIRAALRRDEAGVLQLVRETPSGSSGKGELDRGGKVLWNPVRGGGISDCGRLEGVQAAIHLSGVNVASRRWTPAFKQELISSRVEPTRILAEALAGLKAPPSVLVAASAVGFYGDRGDEILDEDSPAGQGFFPELCQAWEDAAKPAADAGIRVVHLRFGVVLGKGPDGRSGGSLARLAPLFRFGLGGPLGDGRQWMSWIAEADAVGAALYALENPALRGAVNAVAPEADTNARFTQELASALHRPALFAAPKFALRVALGQMADEALLASTRVTPMRLLEAGYIFEHPTLAGALKAAL